MLAGMGPLPGETTASQTEIERRTHLLDEVGLVPPTRDEIAALIDVFPADDGECFGLSWTLLHVIESGPTGPTGTLSTRAAVRGSTYSACVFAMRGSPGRRPSRP